MIPEVEQLHGEHIQGNTCTLGPSDPGRVDIGNKPVLNNTFVVFSSFFLKYSTLHLPEHRPSLFSLSVNPFPQCPPVELILYKSAKIPDICLEVSRTPLPGIGHSYHSLLHLPSPQSALIICIQDFGQEPCAISRPCVP